MYVRKKKEAGEGVFYDYPEYNGMDEGNLTSAWQASVLTGC